MIEHQTIDGRGASVAYFTKAFQPADKASYDYAKVLFDDGEMLILEAPDRPLEGKRLANEIALWNHAVEIIDRSELPMRDVIERALVQIAGVDRSPYGASMRAVDKLMVRVARIRMKAIKDAFRYLRDNS